MGWIIGVDTGGTFTDLCALPPGGGALLRHKRPSTPHNPGEAILNGIREICAQHDIPAASIDRVCHGTTVATNALIQHRGGKLALVTTKGFRDLLEIGRQTRPLIYDFQVDHPPALVPRERRFELDERITRGGEIVTPLAEAEIDRVVAQVRAANVDAVAVCLLFAFAEPRHEREFGAALRKALPGVHVSLSHEVQPEFREYERLSTSVLNAYLQPVMAEYLTHLETRLAEDSPEARLGVNQSSGGLISVARARLFPIRTALSGPAAGISGAIDIARRAGEARVITLDMGGTSADVCLIRDFAASMTADRWVEGYPARISSVDVNAVGAGGGSIAWRDVDGLLKVGPQSAGAVPGPACYRRGGDKPTVSDANIVLGRLPVVLLDGGMTLDADAASRVIAGLASEIGLSDDETALGILDIVVANMARAVRAISVERGFDPREFTLMPFGGAGPLHASAVARSLGMKRILVPGSPGLLCAEGLLVSDDREEFVLPMPMPLDGAVGPVVEDGTAALARRANDWFAAEGIADDHRRIEVRVDLRYRGQNFELGCPITPGEPVDAAVLARQFHETHERSYGFHNDDAPIELVCLRFTAVGRKDSRQEERDGGAGRTPEPASRRSVLFARGARHDTPVYHRAQLQPGDRFEGPAIVDQLDTTIVIQPGDAVRVDRLGNLVIEVDA